MAVKPWTKIPKSWSRDQFIAGLVLFLPAYTPDIRACRLVKKKCTQKYPAVSFAQVCSIGCNPNSLGIFDNRTSALPNNNLTPYSLFIPIFVHLCIYLFTYLFIRRFTRAPVHSIVHLLANQQFINLLIYLQTSCSFTCSFTNS